MGACMSTPLASREKEPSYMQTLQPVRRGAVVGGATLFAVKSHGSYFLDERVRVGKLVSVATDSTSTKTYVIQHPEVVQRLVLPCDTHHGLAASTPISSTYSQQLITCQKAPSSTSLSTAHLPTIIAITPTYKRLTQKVDLVSLCNTIMHVPSLLWVVIEDSDSKSSLVANVLQHCSINSVHLNAGTSRATKKAGQRGVEQRNAGVDWARQYCKEHCDSNCSGVVYFMDDDNKYDLRLFHEVRIERTIIWEILYK